MTERQSEARRLKIPVSVNVSNTAVPTGESQSGKPKLSDHREFNFTFNSKR